MATKFRWTFMARCRQSIGASLPGRRTDLAAPFEMPSPRPEEIEHLRRPLPQAHLQRFVVAWIETAHLQHDHVEEQRSSADENEEEQAVTDEVDHGRRLLRALPSLPDDLP